MYESLYFTLNFFIFIYNFFYRSMKYLSLININHCLQKPQFCRTATLIENPRINIKPIMHNTLHYEDDIVDNFICHY